MDAGTRRLIRDAVAAIPPPPTSDPGLTVLGQIQQPDSPITNGQRFWPFKIITGEGPETEGASCSFQVYNTILYAVNLGSKNPSAGDIVLVYNVGGYWFFEHHKASESTPTPIFSPCQIGGCDAPDGPLRVALYSVWVDDSFGNNPRWELCFEATLARLATPYPLKTYTTTPVDRGIDVYWDHLDQDITVSGGWSGTTYAGDQQFTVRLYLGCPNGKGTYGGSNYTILMGGKGPSHSWTSVAAQPVPFNGNTTRIPPPAGGCSPYNVVQTSVPDETTIAFWAAGNAYYIQVQPAP